MCAYSINRQIWDLVGSLGTQSACAMPGWHRRLSSSVAPSQVSPCTGVGRKRGVTMRSFFLHTSSPPCSRHPDSHIPTSVPVVGQEPGSRCEDEQDHTVASLPPHCVPLHGFTSAVVPLSEHPAFGPVPFQARLTMAFGGFSLRAGPGAGLGEWCVRLGRGVEDSAASVWRQGCAQWLPGVRRARGNSRSCVVGEQGWWRLVMGVCVQG